MPIAEQKRKPQRDLSKQLTLIFGPPKCGKSTLASQFPDACFIATEAGLGSLEAHRWEAADGRYVINSWDELMKATSEVICANRFKTIVLDTIGNACLLCDQFICAKAGEEYKGDGKLGYGKGAAMIIGELRRYLTKLSSIGIGVVLIAHTATKTVNQRTGPIEKTVPFFPADNKQGELYNAVLGMCDLVLFCDQEPGGKRIIRTKPHATYDAGDRSGVLPDTLALGYRELAEAFNSAPQAQTQINQLQTQKA